MNFQTQLWGLELYHNKFFVTLLSKAIFRPKNGKFQKYCSPFKNHQEQLNGLCALNSLLCWDLQKLEFYLLEQPMQTLPSLPEVPREAKRMNGTNLSPARAAPPSPGLCSAGLELTASPSTDRMCC